MAGKYIIGKKATFADPILQLKKRFIIANGEEEKDNNSLPESVADNNHLLPNQHMPLLAFPSEILSPLIDISGAYTPLPPTFQDPKDEKDFPVLPNILQGNYITDQSRNSRQFRTKSGVLKLVDYKNPTRSNKSMLVFHNVFHAKCIS